MPKMSRFLFSFSTRWLLTLGYARGLCCFLDYLTFVLAAGFSCSHSASISTIISSAGCHWIFPIICLMSSCQFAAKPSLAKQPQEAAELAKFDSRAMLTDSSGINHKLHSSLFIKRMSSLDHAHVGRPVKLDWQTVASLVDGKIPVLTIWQPSSEALVEMGRCDGEEAIRTCHAAVTANPSAEQFNYYKHVTYLSSLIRSCLISLS